MRRAAIAALVLFLPDARPGLARVQSAPIQFGIRLNALSSIQWSGETVYVEGERRGYLRTSSGTILDVWPGPVRGSFAVRTTRGIGVLAGRDTMLLTALAANEAILRSPRPDSLFVARYDPIRGRTTISQGRGPTDRILVDLPGRILDFDAADNGTLMILAADGSVRVQAGTNRETQVAHPLSAPAVRVFVNRDVSEIAVLSPSELCRLGTTNKRWECKHFDPTTQAVVRHALSGRPALETKFDAPVR